MGSTDFKTLFARLRAILLLHSGDYAVTQDTETCYSLEAKAGPAAIKAWRGKVNRPMIPVAWVEIGKSYVSYHLMGVYGDKKLLEGMSKGLKVRMQGKTCFNFKGDDETLFMELEKLTAEGLLSFKRSGFVS
jgi:hypothetical protein